MATWTSEPEDALGAPDPDGREFRVLHVAHHQQGEQQHQHHEPLVLKVEVRDGRPVPLRLAERVVHGEGHASRRRRQPGEPAGGRLAGGQDVEPRQPERDRGHVDVRQDPREPAGAGEVEEVDQQRRRHAERNDVHQRVQLGTEAGPGVREPGHPAVEHVEDAGEDDEPSRPAEVAVERGDDGPESEEQVAQRERARHHHHDLPHRGTPGAAAAARDQLHSATTVTPTRVVSPTRACTRAPSGRKRSTRDPNRIIPIRSP